MSHIEHDPKVIIQKKKAKDDLQAKINASVVNIGQTLRKHRGRVQILLNSGKLLEGVVKIATHERVLFDANDLSGYTKLEIKDIADVCVIN